MAYNSSQTLQAILAGFRTRIDALADVIEVAPYRIAFAGSSSPEHYLTQGSDSAPDSRVQASSDGVTFAPLEAGQFGKTAGLLITQALNRPVYYIRGGSNGTSLAQWEANGSTFRAAMVQRINAAGGCEALLLQVGWNDVNSNTVFSVNAQATLIRSLISKIRTETNQPNLLVLIGGSQDNSNEAGISFQREAEMVVGFTDTNVRFGYATYDVDTSDGVHQTYSSHIITGRRFAAQLIAAVRGTAQSRGPRVASAARVSSTQTDVTLEHFSSTDFTPTSAISGFTVQSDGTFRAVSAAVRQSANVVRLTHAAAGDTARTIMYLPNSGNSDNASVLRGNDPLALPIQPAAAPPYVVAPAASGSSPSPSVLQDNFTGTDNTLLTAHTSDSGHSWTVPVGTLRLANNAVFGAGPGHGYSSWVPDAATYEVQGRVLVKDTALEQNLLLLARAQSANSYYWAGLSSHPSAVNSRRLIIGKTVNGTITQLAESVVNFITAGRSIDLAFRVTSAGAMTLAASYNGGSSTLTANDTTSDLAPKGQAGFRSSVSAVGPNAGLHLDSISTFNG